VQVATCVVTGLTLTVKSPNLLFQVLPKCIFNFFNDLNTFVKQQGTLFENAIEEC
jgi:hypothetical protein